MSNYENLNDLEMSLTNHNIEFEQRLTEHLSEQLDSIQTSNTTSTHNELNVLQGVTSAIESSYFNIPSNVLRIGGASDSAVIGGENRDGYGTTFEWHTYHTDGTGAPDHWSEYTTTPTPLYHKWAPYTIPYINPIDKLPELMELILKCIEKGAPPRILIDISEQIKKEGMIYPNDILDSIVAQLNEYLKEDDMDNFVDELVDDIEKTVCGKKNE